jgi:gluconokinase
VVVIVMGAAGAGKTTVGQALARALRWRFVEGDEYHSVEAVAKMRGGQPLTDADRRPWLAALHAVIEAAVARREPLVVTCSALHDAATLRERLTRRTGHFAGPALVASQLAALEEPRDAVTIDATRPVDEIVDTVRYEFGF